MFTYHRTSKISQTFIDLCSLSSLIRSAFFASQSAIHILSEDGSFASTDRSDRKTHKTISRYASLLNACIAQKALNPGKQIHARLFVIGVGLHVHLSTKLVNVYCLCDSLSNARLLFDRIPKRSIFLWNILIRAYAWNGPQEIALSLYYEMIDNGLVPDNFTLPFVLKACSALSALKPGRDIHNLAIRTGWDKDPFVGSALLDMYAKCGMVEIARNVFNKIEKRDAVLWNSMLAAYSQNRHAEEAISLCREMALSGIRPTEGTVVTVISASADMGSLPHGKELHGLSWRLGFALNDRVRTALIDMYAKCGSVHLARRLFEGLRVRRGVSWNAMITGYAMHGFASEALGLFKEMRQDHHSPPDHITFVGVLSACSHGGLLDEGWRYFELMTRSYGMEPTVQHYTCMVDLLGRGGQLDEACNLIAQMRVPPDSGVWGALLNSCKIHKNVELAELALEKLIDLDPHDAGNYVILSNMYAQAGRWDRVARVRNLMTNRGIKKSVAFSWIEVKNEVHSFSTGDTSHPLYEKIRAEVMRVEGLIKETGYVPNTEPVFHDVEDDEKDHMVSSHSERFAIAFGLISTPHRTRLLITKNIRVCEDCHVAIKLISKITEREIIVRDVNRYHHFRDGNCSCQDYW